METAIHTVWADGSDICDIPTGLHMDLRLFAIKFGHGKVPANQKTEAEEILIPTLNPEIYRREGVIFTEVPKKYPQHYDKYLTIRLGAKRGQVAP